MEGLNGLDFFTSFVEKLWKSNRFIEPIPGPA
jgi:hypothetical protein